MGLVRKKDALLCVISAGLLILAFPKTDVWILAWGSLIPLMLALDGKKPWGAFRCAYFCGLLFFTGTLFWFFHITRWFSVIAAVGVVLLFLYLAVYFGLFGLFYSLFSRRKPLFRLILLPSAWVVLEYVRGYLFSGFDWVSLGHSQYKNLAVIQIADITGVYGITFIIVMVNIALKEVITACFINKTSGAQKTLFKVAAMTIFTVCFILGYGMWRLMQSTKPAQNQESLVVAVIQANIPQEQKWQKPAWPGIMEHYINLTEMAAQKKPDLIIWPETSYPGYLWNDIDLFEYLQEQIGRIQIPVLVGSVIQEQGDYFNAALLLSGNGDVVETYRKVHLVPFGEFLPLRSVIPFLSKLVAIGDFSAGQKWTLFSPNSTQGKAKDSRFSVLICFEDTVARLSRQFVRRGAQLLINITNDAWFGDSSAPIMHLQSSVFRTVENRRSLVRAANTGVSCFIDRWGRITNCVEGDSETPSQNTYISGYSYRNVVFNSPLTFYTKFGDVFTIICFGCILWGIVRKKSEKLD